VEVVTAHLRAVSMKASPQGQDATNTNRVHVDEAAQGELAAQVCHGEHYTDYSKKMSSYCQEQLGGRNRKAILKQWEGKTLDMSTVAAQKEKLCTQLLQECPAREPKKGSMGRCEACMESFQTLDFMLRRDSATIQLQGVADPLALAKKKKKRADGFASPLHVEMRLEELCSELHLHYTGGALETTQEVCEEIAGDLSAEVKRAFGVLGRGTDFGNPLRMVCVDAAAECTEKEFDAAFPQLLNFHANVTNLSPAAPRRTDL